jgi:hypothetical protein
VLKEYRSSLKKGCFFYVSDFTLIFLRKIPFAILSNAQISRNNHKKRKGETAID